MLVQVESKSFKISLEMIKDKMVGKVLKRVMGSLPG